MDTGPEVSIIERRRRRPITPSTWGIRGTGGGLSRLVRHRLARYARRMTFSDDSIDRFIAIWDTEFDEKLTPDQARAEASRLMELLLMLMKPLPGEPGYTEPLSEDGLLP